LISLFCYAKTSRKKGDVQDSSKPEDNRRTTDSAHRKASRFNPVDEEDAESATDEYLKRYRREDEVECDLPIYEEIYFSEDNGGSSLMLPDIRPQFMYANNHDLSHGVSIGSASVCTDRLPEPFYANINDASQGVPI
jgi:hypothetical protein